MVLFLLAFFSLGLLAYYCSALVWPTYSCYFRLLRLALDPYYYDTPYYPRPCPGLGLK